MPGTALHAELNAVRALVSHGLAEVSAASEFGQFWIRAAAARLTAADTALIEAAGVVSLPAQALVMGAASFGAVLLSTGAARAAGLGSTGVLVTAALALVVIACVTPWAGGRLRTALGRRRLARLPAPPDPGPILVTVPELLTQARVRLVSATLRHVGSGRWSSPELRHAARADPVTRRLAEADLLLCQAVDCLERYLDDLAKG